MNDEELFRIPDGGISTKIPSGFEKVLGWILIIVLEGGSLLFLISLFQ